MNMQREGRVGRRSRVKFGVGCGSASALPLLCCCGVWGVAWSSWRLAGAGLGWAGLGWAGLGQLLCAFSPAEHDAGLCSAEGLLLKGAAAFRRRKHLPREGGRQRSAHASEEMGTGHEMVVETVCKEPSVTRK